jgi:hypothetical protein
VFTRRATDYRESPVYDLNPAPPARLLQRANALALTDSSGRTYWDATQPYNHPNESWIEMYKSSAMYRTDDCVLVVQNPVSDSDNFTAFPGEGPISFLSHYTMAPGRPADNARRYHVQAHVVYTSQYQRGARAKKTCLLVVRGPFFYPRHM